MYTTFQVYKYNIKLQNYELGNRKNKTKNQKNDK